MNNDMQKHALHPFAIRFFENTGTDETISYALDSFIFFSDKSIRLDSFIFWLEMLRSSYSILRALRFPFDLVNMSPAQLFLCFGF